MKERRDLKEVKKLEETDGRKERSKEERKEERKGRRKERRKGGN